GIKSHVPFYSMLIAAWLNLSDKEINEVIQAGLLHDIGKVKVPNKILNKKGKLTTEEFNTIKKHTTLGHEMLSKIDDISYGVKNAVLLHHERTDGSGYPFGMSTTFIDLYSKIVAIADVFDAMTSDRIYRKRKTPFDVFEMFKTVGVGIFDTTILNIFINKISPYYIGTNVMLNNGERGRIVYIPPRDVLSPIIEIQSDYLDLSVQNNIEILSIGD
ncbi:MAG TPA: HD-GYP domain-containing protein, partial [Clostridia bacterium]|nr:HD-GYP domain-containing protein [Clostridia bacterium]